MAVPPGGGTLKQQMSRITEIARAIAEETESDVYFYTGPIERGTDLNVIQAIGAAKSRPNARLILTTTGGDADAAYKITRYIQDKYEKLTLLVPGMCKSAGTLIAVGAHGIAFSPYGELGPIDVQMYKTDNLAERQSGLTITESLDHLTRSALMLHGGAFKGDHEGYRCRCRVQDRSPGGIRIGRWTIRPHLFSDRPRSKVGDKARSMRIASDYGERLQAGAGNLQDGALDHLTETYPSHKLCNRYARGTQAVQTRASNGRQRESASGRLLGEDARIPDEHKLRFGCLSQTAATEESNESPTNRSRSTEGIGENPEESVETQDSDEPDPHEPIVDGGDNDRPSD